MLVPVGSVWRVTAPFPAIHIGAHEEREEIGSGCLVMVVPPVDVPRRAEPGASCVKFLLNTQPYWAYERDLAASGFCVS
jgi:hypothetical protein